MTRTRKRTARIKAICPVHGDYRRRKYWNGSRGPMTFTLGQGGPRCSWWLDADAEYCARPLRDRASGSSK